MKWVLLVAWFTFGSENPNYISESVHDTNEQCVLAYNLYHKLYGQLFSDHIEQGHIIQSACVGVSEEA